MKLKKNVSILLGLLFPDTNEHLVVFLVESQQRKTHLDKDFTLLKKMCVSFLMSS